ncbi:MAG TPA: hypothetical protein GX696_02375 [Pseudomonadaceae bacterium]|nr:hypothetical protein [Pseudomonadaceae bacterium]
MAEVLHQSFSALGADVSDALQERTNQITQHGTAPHHPGFELSMLAAKLVGPTGPLPFHGERVADHW